MFLVGRNFYHGLDPMNVNELAQQLRIPAGMVKELMELFTQIKLVLPLADEELSCSRAIRSYPNQGDLGLREELRQES